MFRLLMPVRMVDDTPPHTALVIEVEELTMHGGSPARYYQRFKILVLIGHILPRYTPPLAAKTVWVIPMQP